MSRTPIFSADEQAEIRLIASLIPRKDRCLASLVLGGCGLLITLIASLGLLTGQAAMIGIGLTTSAAVLIREFCGTNVPTVGDA